MLNTKLHGREIDYLIIDKNSDNQLKCKIDWGRQSSPSILYYDSDDDLKQDIPEPTTVTHEWEVFIDNIKQLDNMINILGVLEEDEEIAAGELQLKRVS